MGVHITFVRSTNLDSWHWSQLRLMKVGGNAAAAEFFNKKGGAHLLAPSTEGKVKYTSSVAQAYKDELQKRALLDAAGQSLNSPVYFPGLAVASTETATPSSSTKAGGDDDDFFDSWDKPASAAKPAASTTAKPAPAPVSTRAPAAAAAAAPKTVTSASLRASSSAARKTLGAVSRTSSASSTPGTTTPTGTGPTTTASALGAPSARPARAGKLGLGVKKAAAPIDFAAAERKAKEEEAARAAEAKAEQKAEETAREAQKASAEQAEAERIAREAVKAAVGKTSAATPASASSNANVRGAAGSVPDAFAAAKANGDMDRLGMGFGRLGMKANAHQAKLAAERAAAAANNAAAGSDLDAGGDEPSYARNQFSGQKSISSDQYFQRGSYDPQATSEAQQRLQSFQGQTSISSNQYFGRDEDEEAEQQAVQGSGDFADIEATAREYYQRFMANPDVQSSIDSFRAGALKLSQYLEDMSRNGA